MRIIQSIAVSAFASLSFSFAAGQTIMTLRVDAREAPRKILHVQERITGASGALTLFYPKWIPGEHGPTGPIADLVGIKVIAGTDTLPGRRDLVEMFAIHTDVPAGTKELAVNFDFILPPGREGFSSAASSTAQLLVLR